MPLFEGKLITPDDAIARDLCPECAEDLTKVNPIGHFNRHWLTQPKRDKRGQEATRRIKLMTDFIATNNVKTSTQREREAAAPPSKADQTAAFPEATRLFKAGTITGEDFTALTGQQPPAKTAAA